MNYIDDLLIQVMGSVEVATLFGWESRTEEWCITAPEILLSAHFSFSVLTGN